ncbi:hypothetical protein OG455_24150 [Kitasatospora sp. NBC_01287]|uniref:hypothetical protein n=1 Tax=Kitasatospora sp. NBC_01287 TaxID=2903573 RepID=UPI002250B5E0|nr:hypothetical protein [Kitasatospora sp. NBC_01287]MCX4748571.1 hypothetical protein [Kitasatospora sp. NBC_01287]
MSSGNSSDERNPFAPPPEDAPDQPWRPRLPQGHSDAGHDGEDGSRPAGEGRPPASPAGRPPVPPPHPWSPNWQGGGGPGWPDRQPGPQQPRFDPNDPQHRRSRYALMSGMAALFCGLWGILSLALLFSVLAMYWGVGALRSGGRDAAPGAERGPEQAADQQPGAPTGWPYTQRSRPQLPAALGGLLTGGVALALVLGSFALDVAYRPYFTCVNDALTSAGEQSCADLAPHWLVSYSDPQN